MTIIQTTIWKGKTYGIYIGKPKRNEYFDSRWDETNKKINIYIEIEIDENIYSFKLTPSFWNKCVEIRDCEEKAIYKWLDKKSQLLWNPVEPPDVELVIISDRRFQLRWPS